MKQKYKNKEWLKKKLVDEGVTMAEIGRQFNRDITTIRYWRDKFNIEVEKEVKWPVKEYICPVCGKEFKKRVTKNVQAVYCSQECAYKGRSLGITERKVNNNYNSEPTKINLTCQFCGDDFTVNKTEKDRKYCSRECFLKSHKERMQGENNPAWNGGSSYDKRSYRGDNWDKQKKKCYKRDNYKCQICGVECIGRKEINQDNGKKLIQCHHIKEFETIKDNKLDNLITLCASCHTKLHEGVLKLEMD